MTNKLCVCLTEKTSQECIDFLKATDADIVEHRIDFMGQISGLELIYSATNIPIIATCRPHELGGHFGASESQRIELLSKAIVAGVSFVDVETETDDKHFHKVHQLLLETDCQIIVSKHYTQFTPERAELLDVIERMRKQGADILKVVVTPQTIHDCLKVLQLYNLEDLDTPLIAFAMGNLGKFTRVSSLFLGAPFTYVSQDIGEAAS
ncbi:MAG: type I 3-dehydroquinate dehydratase [Candidatus Thorarchaeota archaeon]|jgi:3-dehydroquinate dehydratase-1